MKKLFILLTFFSFICGPILGFAQEEAASSEENKAPAVKEEAQKDASAEGEKAEEMKVKFAPKNNRDPFLSKEEIERMEKDRRSQIEQIEKNKRERERALIAEREAEKARLEKEAYYKANPQLAIIKKIKIQGMMGDEVQINNDFKGVGDKVFGATITKITNTKIHFKYKGKDFTMPIPKSQD